MLHSWADFFDITSAAGAGATTLLLISGVYGAWDLTLWMVADRHKP